MHPLLLPVIVSAVAGGAFAANEWTHGGMAQTMGLGHHHLFDDGGYHCATHDDRHHGAEHVRHMHGNESMPHDHCPGGRGMHHNMSQRMGGPS